MPTLTFRASNTLAYSCAASIRMRADIPMVESDAMRWGTQLHDHVAYAFALGMPDAARDNLPVDLPDWAEDLIRDSLDILGAIVAAHPGWRIYVEQYVRMGHHVGVDADAWRGTADYILIAPDGKRAIIADLKTGVMPVAATSKQLLGYAVGLLDLAPALESVEAVIIQPRAPKRVDAATYTRADLDTFIEDMRAFVPMAISEESIFSAGSHCAQCDALQNCAAGADYVLSQVPGVGAINWDPTRISDERLAALLAVAPALKKLLEGAQEEATTRLRDGKTIPGFKLGSKRTLRRWRDQDEFIRVATDLGLDLDQFAPRKVVSPASALRLVQDADALTEIGALVIKPTGAATAIAEKLDQSGSEAIDLKRVLPVLFSQSQS